MTILVTIQAQLVVGEEQVIKSLAPEGMLAAVFEDDGRTGYFYALDESVEGNPIAPVVERLNGIEAHLDQERAVHHQKTLELERSQPQKGFELGM